MPSSSPAVPSFVSLSVAALCLVASCSDGSSTDASGTIDVPVVSGDTGDGAMTEDLATTDTDETSPPDVSNETEPPDLANGDDIPAEDAPADEPDVDTGTNPATTRSCFADQLGPDGEPMVDYDALGAVIASHCMGTNHQEITDIERVVFVGDSVAVGTPPTPSGRWYRNLMADALAARFGLEAPSTQWRLANVIDGVALEQVSGDFACCAKWGARTDDLTRPPHEQIKTCIPEDQRDKRTLIVITVGGNDFFAWAQDLVDGVAADHLRAMAVQAVADLETSIHWVVDDPDLFPNGVFVIFANPFEFTDVDAAKDFATCPGADIISMHTALVDPLMAELSTMLMEEYMRIAVETGTDMAFMGERFCGRGSMRNDPRGRCYRGPDIPNWLDLTCMHPSADGHAGIAEMYLRIIAE